MAQVQAPNEKKDDSLNTILSGLGIYANVSDMQVKNAQAEAKVAAEQEAMRRRIEELNKQGGI